MIPVIIAKKFFKYFSVYFTIPNKLPMVTNKFFFQFKPSKTYAKYSTVLADEQ